MKDKNELTNSIMQNNRTNNLCWESTDIFYVGQIEPFNLNGE